jgi:hypothetical protein
MKKYILFLLFLASATTLKAQDMAVNLYGGYVFGDDITLQYGYGHVDESAIYGGSLEFNMPRNVSVELSYQYQSTTASANQGLISDKGNIAVSYVMIEGNRYARFKEQFAGYFGGGLGIGIVTPDTDYSTICRLAWKIKAGLLITPSDKFGIKLGMQLNSLVQGIGGGLYFGTGGASAGASLYSSIYQFGFNGGIYFRFGKDGSN